MNWEKEYNPAEAYNQSKLANILFTVELSKRLKGFERFCWQIKKALISNKCILYKGNGVIAVCLHPGMVNTEITRNVYGCYGCLVSCTSPIFGLFFLTPKEGAQTTIYCATSRAVRPVNRTGFQPVQGKPVCEPVWQKVIIFNLASFCKKPVNRFFSNRFDIEPVFFNRLTGFKPV